MGPSQVERGQHTGPQDGLLAPIPQLVHRNFWLACSGWRHMTRYRCDLSKNKRDSPGPNNNHNSNNKQKSSGEHKKKQAPITKCCWSNFCDRTAFKILPSAICSDMALGSQGAIWYIRQGKASGAHVPSPAPSVRASQGDYTYSYWFRICLPNFWFKRIPHLKASLNRTHLISPSCWQGWRHGGWGRQRS